jgi:hypothetical protein
MLDVSARATFLNPRPPLLYPLPGASNVIVISLVYIWRITTFSGSDSSWNTYWLDGAFGGEGFSDNSLLVTPSDHFLPLLTSS